MSGSEKRSNLTRRGLLKATGATVGAAALIGGGVLRALGPDEGAFAEEPEDQTKCRVGCCWTCVYCQYEAHVRDGKIVKLSPIEGGSPRGSRMVPSRSFKDACCLQPQSNSLSDEASWRARGRQLGTNQLG